MSQPTSHSLRSSLVSRTPASIAAAVALSALLVVAFSALPNGHAQSSTAPITMFGTDFQADSFVWCLDRSCSMGWGTSLNELKVEVTAAIDQLSPGQTFSVIAYGSNYSVFSANPVDATPGNKASAIAWVNSLSATGSTVVVPPVVAALQIASQSSGAAELLLVADGAPTSQGASAAIAQITQANSGQIPIHTFLLGSDGSALSFLQQLAAMNHGVFVDTNGLPPVSMFIRGDVNGDGSVNLPDVVTLLEHLFSGSAAPPCPDAADANSDLNLALDDAVTLLAYLFTNGPAPGSPGPTACGPVTGASLGACTGQSCP